MSGRALEKRRSPISNIRMYCSSITHCSKRDLSVSTIETVHGLLHPTFQMAVRDNIIRTNPSDNVMAEIKKKNKGRPEPRRALTVDQQQAFMKYLDEIRPTYHHVEDCMHTIPEALECFLEADSYESCLRNVMYIGGDTDTLGAIAGAIAEAYWGIPVTIIAEAKGYLDDEIEAVVGRF